ncbi:MAG: peptide deformylase [Defluviitaleaceae bacterium]|nr:peptide deformylase [Defluviitaleaceae bacterium]
MAVRTIRLKGDEILRKRSKEVKVIDQKILDLLDDLRDTMIDRDGIGISAVQIGSLKRVALITGEDDEIIELINPVVLEASGEQAFEEACLSVPNFHGEVLRPDYVEMEALDRNGDLQYYELEGTYAVIFMHELDHLDGILYTDKLIEKDE